MLRRIATYTNVDGHTYCQFKYYSGDHYQFAAITSVALTYYYYQKEQATGSLNKTSVIQGNQINVTINSADRCPDFTYKVKWYRDDDHQTTVDYGGDGLNNLVKTFTVPSNWPVGAATATIYTYYNNEQIDSGYSLSFTINVDPNRVLPTYDDFTVTLVNDRTLLQEWGVYVQGYSKCRLVITNPDPEIDEDTTKAGATIKDIYLRCGS